MVTWSEISVNNKPPNKEFSKKYVNMLSMRIDVWAVILVGHVIKGSNMAKMD